MIPRSQICLVIGTPRGFTRSVLEALLKRGSRVILACPDPSLGYVEHRRLSALYGNAQISVNVVEGWNLRKLESLLLRALDTHGGVTHIVNSTADNKLLVHRKELVGRLDIVERYLDRKQQQLEVQSIKDVSKLAVKYLGKHNGFSGGSLLNLVSRTELCQKTGFKSSQQQQQQQQQASHQDDLHMLQQSSQNSTLPHHCQPLGSSLAKDHQPDQTSQAVQDGFVPSDNNCTVLGTTRALGLSKQLSRHGVNTQTVYNPNIDYPELSPASQITDDQHSPYYTWNRYSAYCREYTGYMSLHIADTAESGTAWRFNSELRLEQVDPSSVPCTCKLTNKMCYWLGCPHVDQMSDLHTPAVNLGQEEVNLDQTAVNQPVEVARGWADDTQECQDN